MPKHYEHRPQQYEVQAACIVLRELLASDTLHTRDAQAVHTALRALKSPTMEHRERMLEQATTPEQRNPPIYNWVTDRRDGTQKRMFGEWRNGFMAALALVFGQPKEMDE